MKPFTMILAACAGAVFPTFAAESLPFAEPAELPARPELPDPLTLLSGEKLETAEQWTTSRRAEVQRLFEHYVYGKSPKMPGAGDLKAEVLFEKPVFGGKGVMREVKIDYLDGAPPVFLLIVQPKSDTPVPVFVGLNFGGNHTTTDNPDVKLSEVWAPSRHEGVVDNRSTEASRGVKASRWPFELAVDRGYAIATLYHGDLDPDFHDWSNGVHPLFFAEGQTKPEPGEWGAIGAWAWGLSLAASHLIEDKSIDGSRVCVMGHSRNGKTALWAGAQDERFALVVSNNSGCGGAALSRPRRGEKVSDINKNFPHWFGDRFPSFDDREDHLPVDQHMLLALCAPRPVLVCSAEEDTWADPEGEFASCIGADPVYQLLGTNGLAGATEFPKVNVLTGGRIAYHIRPGKHDVGPADWAVFFDFADRELGLGERR